MINLRPSQGNMSRGVEDERRRAVIRALVERLVIGRLARTGC